MDGLSIRDAISPVVFLVGLVGLVAIALNLCDCKPAAEPSALPRFCTSEELYTAELVRCVDRAETLAQSQQCRSAVDYRCGIVQVRAR
jgi:hypothetical protein